MSEKGSRHRRRHLAHELATALTIFAQVPSDAALRGSA
jgi:hypothetical protein